MQLERWSLPNCNIEPQHAQHTKGRRLCFLGRQQHAGILLGYITGMMKHVTSTEHELAAGTTTVDPDEDARQLTNLLKDQAERQT